MSASVYTCRIVHTHEENKPNRWWAVFFPCTHFSFSPSCFLTSEAKGTTCHNFYWQLSKFISVSATHCTRSQCVPRVTVAVGCTLHDWSATGSNTQNHTRKTWYGKSMFLGNFFIHLTKMCARYRDIVSSWSNYITKLQLLAWPSNPVRHCFR